MYLTHYQPWGLMNQLQSNLHSLFDRPQAESWRPAVDIHEEAGRFVLRADLPGVDPKDIEIALDDGVLSIHGARQLDKDEDRDGYRRVERLHGGFHRRFTLPDTADAAGISARSDKGVLEVVIPKQPKAQPRRIAVQA